MLPSVRISMVTWGVSSRLPIMESEEEVEATRFGLLLASDWLELKSNEFLPERLSE